MHKLKSRKFWLAIILTAIFIIMKWFNKLDDSNFMQGILTLFGIYTGANVVTKFIPQREEGKDDGKEVAE